MVLPHNNQNFTTMNELIILKVKQNDYEQPTEIRNWLVQKICDYIVKRMDKQDIAGFEDTYTLTLRPNNRMFQLWLKTGKDGEIVGFWNSPEYGDYERIRTIEMQLVFQAMQDAGYFIFYNETSDLHEYRFSKKPMLGVRKATRVEFAEYID